MGRPVNSLWQRLLKLYQQLALFLLNTLVMLFVINCLLGVAFIVHDRSSAKPQRDFKPPPARGRPKTTSLRTQRQLDYVDMEAYDGVPSAEVEKVLDEFTLLYRKGFVYQPWVQFSEPPFSGKLVNVDTDERGFTCRRSVLDPNLKVDEKWPVVDVCVFGGSTTFGYNVADEWTYCSYLWDELQRTANQKSLGVRIRLRNYGRAFYYSSQEVTLLYNLLKTGYRPQIVIFLDGLNDCMTLRTGQDLPAFTDLTRQMWESAQFRGNNVDRYHWIPMVRLASYLSRRVARREDEPVRPSSQETSKSNLPVEKTVGYVLRTYQENVRVAKSLCKEYGIRCYFFWQPTPFFHYDLALHRYFPPEVDQRTFEVYRGCYQKIQTQKDGPIFLGNLIKEFGASRKVFVDDYHYNPSFNRFLAQKMARFIDLGGLPARSSER